MDVEWSKLVELEHPWYQGVTLYTISRRAEHNSKSYQRYLDGLDLAKFILATVIHKVLFLLPTSWDAHIKNATCNKKSPQNFVSIFLTTDTRLRPEIYCTIWTRSSPAC